MRKFLSTVLDVFLIVVGVCGVFAPVVYWFFHTDLTYIQLFLKMWWAGLIGMISFILLMVRHHEDY